MDQWTKWVRVKSCGKLEYNTASKIVPVMVNADGYSYAVVDSATARDLCIRHKFEICAPPKAAQKAPEPEPEAKPEPTKRKRRTRKKTTSEE